MQKTNEERLSKENSNLKVVLWETKAGINLGGYKQQYEQVLAKLQVRDEKIEDLRQMLASRDSEIDRLKKKIEQLKYPEKFNNPEPLEEVEIDKAVVYPKSTQLVSYVTLKMYNAQKKQTEYFVNLYHKEKEKNNASS